MSNEIANEKGDDTPVAIPALLRAARGSYGLAIRNELAEAGITDLPPNSAYVLGGMANFGMSASDLIRGLGVSKQAASQLIDVLVLRGYLVRDVNPEDRRRLTIALTDRGRDAAAAVRAGVVLVDTLLKEKLSPQQFNGLREGLIGLIEIREQLGHEQHVH